MGSYNRKGFRKMSQKLAYHDLDRRGPHLLVIFLLNFNFHEGSAN